MVGFCHGGDLLGNHDDDDDDDDVDCEDVDDEDVDDEDVDGDYNNHIILYSSSSSSWLSGKSPP